MTLLSPSTRARIARSTAALLAMPELLALVDAEVAATFSEHPALPPTEQARRILWALALTQLNQAAENTDQKGIAA